MQNSGAFGHAAAFHCRLRACNRLAVNCLLLEIDWMGPPHTTAISCHRQHSERTSCGVGLPLLRYGYSQCSHTSEWV